MSPAAADLQAFEGGPRSPWRRILRPDLIILLVCALAFALHCLAYEVIQDDAYISLAYAQNLTLGNGLVFNVGERVEGYTNFLWTLALVIPHLLSVDAPRVAQGLGLIAAVSLLVVTWRLSRGFCPRRSSLYNTPAILLLAANGSLAFWTLSGMETSLFALLVLLGAVLYLQELRSGHTSAWTSVVMGVAALTRPEGILVFGLTFLHRLGLQIARRDLSVQTHLKEALPFLALVLPHFAFRYLYYGHLLPNTLYAKTGVSLTQVQGGVAYTLKFLGDYGFWGLGLAAPILLCTRERRRPEFIYLGLLVNATALYATAVGGDTLPENRLFLPILAPMCIGLQEILHRVVGTLAATGAGPGRRKAVAFVAAGLVLAGAAYSYGHARPDLLHAQRATATHNDKLFDLVDFIDSWPEPRRLLVSSTAIGIPRYFTAASVLDLVGLTDEVIARRPVRLPGLHEDHVLRRYHPTYVMDRAPDLIFFIAGERPVTPAEKALFLSRRFRKAYYLTYITDSRPVWVKRRDPGPHESEELFASGQFIELYAEALVATKEDRGRAISLLEQCVDLGPEDFAYSHAWLGRQYYQQHDLETAVRSLERALAIDPHLVAAYWHLAMLRVVTGQAAVALGLAERGLELAPNSHYGHYCHGRGLLAAGRLPEAARALGQAVRLGGPSSVDAILHMGVALHRQGDDDGARMAWEAVLEADPSRDDAREFMQRLGRP